MWIFSSIDTYSDLQFPKPGFALFRRRWYMRDALDKSEKLRCLINPRTYTQIHTPTVVQGRVGGGGVDGTPPRSFSYVAVFWNDFTFSWKPLIFLRRWSIFYGWWRCRRPVTSPTMLAILVLQRIRNQVKTARNANFFCLTWKKDINKHLAWF